MEHLQGLETVLRRSPCASSTRLRRSRSYSRQNLHQTETSDLIAWVLDKAQHCQHVFDVRSIKELEATELHKRNIAADKLDLQRPAVV